MGSPYLLEPEICLDGTMIILTTGVMGAGKTAALLNAVEQMEEKKAPFFIIKPELDTRTPEIWSRDGRRHACEVVGTQEELSKVMSLHEGYDTLFVDEAQFFNAEFIKQICMLANVHGIQRVMFYSLKTDYMDNLFEGWKEITLYANQMFELSKWCELCGKQIACHNLRTSGGDALFEVGTSNYKAVCHKCWNEEHRG